MKVFVFIMLVALSISCKEEKTLLSSLNSSETNIDFQNKLTPTADLNILNYLYYYNGSGVSAGDFNNDGLADLYFTSNQSTDKLYINQGNFKFKDVTDASGIDNATNWTTGSTAVDINNDGLLDIYISKVSEYNNIKGHNLLYVNQGIVDGIPSFKEESVKFGLNSKGFSTHSVFFDYDQDEDLDLFILNHSVHPNRNFGLGKQREVKDSLSGDRLLRNDNGIFKDVSSEAGIYQGKIGYGLGVSVGDINNDGFPDIYVGNDFFENDYLYINQQNGSFKEMISEDGEFLGHTSHFSMGNSIDDLNNDGLSDIVSLDMLPEDIITYKSSGIEYPYSTYERFLKNGYTPQFMQNTLHLNNGDAGFSEIGHLSGIAASEWSWSPIVADLDNDGYKDIYVTNGILGATNDMDFINFISNDSIQKRLGSNMDPEDLSFADAMPTKKLVNYL
ncbi:MAG: VCBS repeat-containing protein, partial [Bacteroidia bacterium]|nr:VCBS repeat-containing protein [Bacteroidia bacterium]NNK28945.1 VCBS repeat-containing protein [Flavobacteriaceae bacterium]